MPKKSLEKVLLFRDNYISIGYVKLPLLRRLYFWSAVKVLKNRPEILPIINRDFFEILCLPSDQWIS